MNRFSWSVMMVIMVVAVLVGLLVGQRNDGRSPLFGDGATIPLPATGAGAPGGRAQEPSVAERMNQQLLAKPPQP